MKADFTLLGIGAIAVALLAVGLKGNTAQAEFVGPPDPAALSFMVAQRQELAQVSPAQPQKRQWYGMDTNKASCIESNSPADKMREIALFGQQPGTKDLSSGAVEVSRELSRGRTEVWTFYPTMDACSSSLPRNKPINSRYE